MKNKNKINKSKGKVYTPDFIVEHILNLSNYKGRNIIEKHVIDNSCGDGAFLMQIVKRYICENKKINKPLDTIKKDLETYIHGIEIDLEESKRCIKNLTSIAENYEIYNVNWDIICGNALDITKYNGKMSFVLGNPPYVRVHNLNETSKNIKNFNFTKSGMTDLFIVFYEIGLNMLENNGILGYITPSSLFNSIACKYLRKYIVNNNLLKSLVDLKHNQVFDATTYTTITILDKGNNEKKVDYYEYNNETKKLSFIDKLTSNDYYIAENFYFSTIYNLKHLKNILEYKNSNKIIEVKNGFATLNDDFFIGNFNFKEFIIPIIKASTGEEKECLFPYKNNILVPYDILTKNSDIKNYYERYKEDLSNRSLEKNANWYGFGRSQGIKDVYKNKYSINSLIKDLDSIKLIPCKSGTGIYSGLYILTDIQEKDIKKAIINDKFLNYISLLGKYKSGGYYTFSSNDLRKFLEYEFGDKNEQ